MRVTAPAPVCRTTIMSAVSLPVIVSRPLRRAEATVAAGNDRSSSGSTSNRRRGRSGLDIGGSLPSVRGGQCNRQATTGHKFLKIDPLFDGVNGILSGPERHGRDAVQDDPVRIQSAVGN